ncbi:pyrroloquinoline quinone biosynthesis protein PqqF [Sodalis sp. dw_96]|uniref:pyrroloquinoline quinone biosynthesis protein PqqF n=1 Tax=Sodalis sp. dw_96 TaxID=2719794 RepID=UPI001BD36159|nr:pyrroloquinoline quinone biosynthesis protein PqqF [Sodalis sp. dw_96]
MKGVRQEARQLLANGLTLCLRHDAWATEAAALLRVEVGSDAEPTAWPGLAHLLEHLLFTGGRAYQQQQRLLSWIPAQGGRLNATTRGDRTAFFFAVDPPKLAPGLARLTDMLAAPLFDLAALEQEINVIDAEYRLLMADADTLCDAAQLYLFDGAPALRRFQAGSRAGFGGDLPSLWQALRDFHREHYQAGRMTLWLQGPQPLAELRALAESYGASLPATRTVIPASPLRLTSRGDAMLQVAGGPRLRLSFALNGWRNCDAGGYDILRALLNDEADGSLMAWLRERDWCDGADLINSWRGPDTAIVAVEFTLTRDDPALGVQVERAFLYWLTQLSALSDNKQLRHYARLAQRRFDSQTPLDQLRDLAFDASTPQRIDTQSWRRWLARFRPEGISRLWLSEQVTGSRVHSRGFDLQLAPFTPPFAGPVPMPTLCFYADSAFLTTHQLPQAQPMPQARPMPQTPPLPQTQPALPSQFVRLRQIAAGETAVLTLYPAPCSGFTELQGHILHAALRATAANLAHGGSELRIERRQGVWLLQLCADDAMMPRALEVISERLRDLPEAVIRQGQRARQHELWREQGQIPVRRLLSQLPGWLGTVAGDNASNRPPAAPGHGMAHWLGDVSWQGTLYGGTAGLHHQLSRLLSRFPGTFAAPEFPTAAVPFAAASELPAAATPSGAAPELPTAATPNAARYTLPQAEGDHAFILFCPLPAADIDSQLAWRLLALIYQPWYFQQLRVEQNIGYVANCSFYDTAWRAGIVFALQSPHFNGEELHQRTLAFLQWMETRLDEMPAELLAERRASLWRMLTCREPNRFIRAGQACFIDPAIVTSQARERLEHIDPMALKRWHRIFIDSAKHSAGNIVATTA